MGHTTTTITAPVNTDDVSAVLNVASHDVATLCAHEKNNKWSKRKPLRKESPDDFATWDKSAGNIPVTAGYPIIWGMQLPFNTSQQVGSVTSLIKPLATRAAHLFSAQSGACANVKNYVYMRPRIGTDFCNLGHYDGYNHKAPESWTCGVRGATVIAGSDSWTASPGMLLNVDAFDTAEVEFFIGGPSNADITFADLYPEDDYHFVAELYDSGALTTDSTNPKATLVSMAKVKDMLPAGGDFACTVQWLKTIFTTETNGATNFRVVLGVARLTGVTLTEMKRTSGAQTGLKCGLLPSGKSLVAGSGSIPPWTDAYKPFLCQITMASYSKMTVTDFKYCAPNVTQPSESLYKDFPTAAINIGDGFFLKFSIRNDGTKAIQVNGNYPSSRYVIPRIQIQAWGAFDTNDPSYSALCLSPAEGKWHDISIYNDAPCTSSSYKTIASGVTTEFYAKCFGIMPIGRVSRFNLRVSTDNGENWYITGSFSGAFLVQ